MARELLTFQEGSAWIYTGNASGIGTYVRGVNVRLTVGRVLHRPPHNDTAYYRETGREAFLDISQAYNELRWAKLHQLASGGSVFAHIQHATPLQAATDTSGGIFLYSGELRGVSFAGQDGNAEQTLSIQARFPTWSAY